MRMKPRGEYQKMLQAPLHEVKQRLDEAEQQWLLAQNAVVDARALADEWMVEVHVLRSIIDEKKVGEMLFPETSTPPETPKRKRGKR